MQPMVYQHEEDSTCNMQPEPLRRKCQQSPVPVLPLGSYVRLREVECEAESVLKIPNPIKLVVRNRSKAFESTNFANTLKLRPQNSCWMQVHFRNFVQPSRPRTFNETIKPIPPKLSVEVRPAVPLHHRRVINEWEPSSLLLFVVSHYFIMRS